MNDKPGWITWIDYTRVLAILMVVLCHAVEMVYPLSDEFINTFSLRSKIFAFGCFSLGRIGVPLFLMITGYLLLDRTYDTISIQRFWSRNWLHLLICAWIWITIYDLYLVFFFNAQICPLLFLKDLLFVHKVEFSHIWYITMILGMYILIPFVALALKSVDIRILTLPMIVYTVYAFLYPTIRVYNNVLSPEHPLSIQFSLGFSGGAYGLYIIFGFLVKKGLLKKVDSIVLGILSVVSFATVVWFQIWAREHGVTYKVWYDNIMLLLTSVCGFELLSRLRITYGYALIKEASKYSFSVYLIHLLVIKPAIAFSETLPLSRSLTTLMIWLVGTIASYIIAKMISMIPKVGNYILYIKQ